MFVLYYFVVCIFHINKIYELFYISVKIEQNTITFTKSPTNAKQLSTEYLIFQVFFFYNIE